VCTVTALESGTGQSGATTITQSGATTNSLVITATPQSLPDNGSTSTLSLLATGADASGETVTLTGFPSVSGSCGSFAGSVTTGTNGAVTTTYPSSAVVGSCTILASAAASGTTGTVVIAQTPVSTVYAEAISINPTTIPADGKSTSSVTAGVTENGGGLANDVVTFTLGAPSEPGSCGTLASTTETTGSNGVTPADTYTASTVPGTCSITAKDADGSTVAATYITQQLTANTGVLISAVPASVTANGTSTSTLTVDVLVDGAGVSGDTVTLTGVGSPTGSCGSFPSSVTTGTNGAVTTTYTSSTTPGTCTIVATGPSGTGTSTVSITQTAIANVYNETITATPNVVIANGSSTSNILDTVTDNGTPVSGDVVTFTAQPSVTGACGTLASTETTAANGTTPTDTYAASSTVGTCTITAKDADGGVSASVVITQQASVSSEVIITANPDQVAANGTSTSTLTAGVFTNGAADNGDVVTLVGVPSAAGSCGSFPSTLTTGANGLATGTYTSSDVVGTCTILATGPAGTGTATVTISQVPVANVYNETITATPNVVIANGSSTSNILDTVTDNGTAVSGDVVTFTLQPSVANACGTLFSPTETTLANGTTPTDVYTASSTVGSCTVTAKDADGGVSASVVITQQASVSSEVIITANPEQVTANGTSSSTLTAGVFTNGAADNNDAVTLVGVPSAAGSCGSFPSTLTTGANGLATGTYTSSDVAGTCTILATGPAGTGTATVTISQTPVANVYNEDITATPNSLSANGKATSSILVGVTKNGVALGGDVVTFTLQPSVTGACGSLSSTTETTGANGITPSDTYTASSTAGTCTIIATEADGNVSANVVITQTVVAPVATKVVVTATPDSQLLVGDTSTITVETESATGTAVPDQNIVFTTSGNGLLGACGSVSPTSGTTNSSGVLTATYTVPNLAGILGLGLLATCTVTATDTSVTPNISGSASITETLDILALGAGLL
jgi:adhesin/invasin